MFFVEPLRYIRRIQKNPQGACRPWIAGQRPALVHCLCLGKPVGSFCESRKEDPKFCRWGAKGTELPGDHIDVLVAMPTVRRPEVGFVYLRETVSGFLKLPMNGRLVFHPRVFEFKHGSNGSAFTPKSTMFGDAIDAADKRLVVEHVQTKNVMQEWSNKVPPRGMWHPLNPSERQHNQDMLAMMRRLEGQCNDLIASTDQVDNKKRLDRCADTVMVMLT